MIIKKIISLIKTICNNDEIFTLSIKGKDSQDIRYIRKYIFEKLDEHQCIYYEMKGTSRRFRIIAKGDDKTVKSLRITLADWLNTWNVAYEIDSDDDMRMFKRKHLKSMKEVAI